MNSDFIVDDRSLLISKIFKETDNDLSERAILTAVDDLLKCRQAPVLQIDSAKIFAIHIETKDDEFYLEFYRVPAYSTEEKRPVSSLVLFSLVLPVFLQRKGIGSKIFLMFENEALTENINFVVCPVMEVCMHNFLQKRKFKQDYLMRYTFIKN